MPNASFISLLPLSFSLAACQGEGRYGAMRGSAGEAQVLARNLDTPWGMAFLPGGGFLFTERPGRVGLFQDGAVRYIGTLEAVERGEGGALGIALDPDFASNRGVYIYYTRVAGNRISRFEWNGSLANEQVLVGDIPLSSIHNGGRIAFGPDGFLYATTGDAAEPSLAQDTASLAGKILRIRRDGGIPEDNPFGNAVYSYGHRNPQGLAWQPGTGRLYASEHGPDRMDEINLIEKGANYGWPLETCDKASRFRAPVRCYEDFTLAPAGAAFYRGRLFVAGLRGRQLRRIELTPDGRGVASETVFFEDLGRLRISARSGGQLYFSTSNRDGRGNPAQADDRIFRVVSLPD